jgi:ribonuclease HII
MTDADRLQPALLKRKTVVYFRQTTQAQIHHNLETNVTVWLVDEARRPRNVQRAAHHDEAMMPVVPTASIVALSFRDFCAVHESGSDAVDGSSTGT